MKKLLAVFLVLSAAVQAQQHYFFSITGYNAQPANLTDSTISILKKRLSHAGIKDCNVAYIAEKMQFEITCGNFSDTAFIAATLTKPYKVIFFETYKFEELASLLQPNAKTPVKTKQAQSDFFRLTHASDNSRGKIGSVLLGFVDINDTAAFSKTKKSLEDDLPADVLFAYQLQTERNKAPVMLYALRNNNAILPIGKLLDSAALHIDDRGYPTVSLSFNALGAKLFHRMTLKNTGRQIAIVIDGKVYSAPNIIGPIEGGKVEISGSFTLAEVKEFIGMLNAGQLPLQLKLANNVSL